MEKIEEVLRDMDSNDFLKVQNLLNQHRLSKMNAQVDDTKNEEGEEGTPFRSAFDQDAPLFMALDSLGIHGKESEKEDVGGGQKEDTKLSRTKKKVVSAGSHSTGEAKRSDSQMEKEKDAPKKRHARSALETTKPALQSLSAFGFSSSTIKNSSDEKRKLFSTFVQDKRIAPERIRFWDAVPPPLPEPTAPSVPVDPFVAFREEDSSLMHPPTGYAESPCEAFKRKNFSEWIEASNRPVSVVVDGGAARSQPLSLAQQCPCANHCSQALYSLDNFDSEVIFCGFYAVAYDPFLARPPYFGTYNQFTNENITEGELLKLGRFPAGEEAPRFATLDYDYDSGDDWDLLEGDEAIGSSLSSSGEDDASGGSLSSSDLDFINDDDDESDSDNELQRNIIEARRRRMNRLKGKDKLVPSFSGPFIGVLPQEHPLQNYDRLDAFAPLHQENFFSSLLEEELTLFGGVGNASVRQPDQVLNEAEMRAAVQQKIQDSALKNRREMTSEELDALHLVVRLSNRSSTKTLLELLRDQDMCIGVAQSEFSRTVKRFYERRHGMLVRRDVPWDAVDERLFAKQTAKEKEQGGDKKEE